MSLENLIKEIKSLKETAEENLETGDIATLGTRRGRQRQAIEQLANLKVAYKEELMKSAMFIVVVGSERKQFEEITTSNPKIGFFSENPDDFYKDLASRIPQALYHGRTNVANLFDVLGRHLEDKAREIGIDGYPQMIFKEDYTNTSVNPEAFQVLVKKAINEQVGSEVVGIQAISSILDKAIDKGYNSKVVPVVLGTDDAKFANAMMQDLPRLSRNVFLVKAGQFDDNSLNYNSKNSVTIEEVNTKSVTSALSTINKLVKK